MARGVCSDPIKEIERCQKISTTNKGRIISEEARRKTSATLKGRLLPQITKEKIRESMRLLPPRSEEWRKNLSESLKGKKYPPISEETRKKLSDARMGEKNPFFGKKHSEKTLKKLSEKLRGRESPMKGLFGEKHPSYGRHCTLETKIKIAEAQRGERGNNWNGGTSFEPYCEKFNVEFKERVRAFFGYICPECGTPQNGRRLHVHHVNFNKMACCDDTIPVFVSLCGSCHRKTQFNRTFWEQYFTDMVNTFYEGRSYLTKKEFKAICIGGD